MTLAQVARRRIFFLMKIYLLSATLLFCATTGTPLVEAAPAPRVSKISFPRIARIAGAVCAPVADGPDVVLEQLDDARQYRESAGEQIVNDDPRQTLAAVVEPGGTQNYLVHIENRGQSATTFRVSLGGLLSATGAETPWAPQGWTASATNDEQGADILAQLKSKQGWETPRIDLGAETVIKLSLTAPDTTETPLTDGSFRVVARNGTQSDAVIGRVGSQFISKIQWALDGDADGVLKWHDVDEKTLIKVMRHEAIGVRALKAVPSAPWGGNEVLGPTWTFQGNRIDGDELWLEARVPTLLGAPVTATLGTSFSFQVRVLPSPYVHLKAHKPISVKSPQTEPCRVSVMVEDEEYKPLANIKVRLRVFSGKNAIIGFWTPEGTEKATQIADEILSTDDQGKIEVDWAVAAGVVPLNTQIVFKAEAINEEGAPFGMGDTYPVRLVAADVQE